MSTKYYNDTSPERLAWLRHKFLADEVHTSMPECAAAIHDLLAMVEEQRWHKCAEELPGQLELVQVHDGANLWHWYRSDTDRIR